MGLIVLVGVTVLGALVAIPLMTAWMDGKLDGKR